VYRALQRRADRKQFPHDNIPSERTISNIAREVRSTDESGAWRITDADPATVRTVLNVLAEVVRRTEGRITSLTREEAALIPTVRRAMSARWTKLPEPGRRWQTYVWTRFYLAWVQSERDAEDVALFFAFLQENGKIPLPIWARRIERVNAAAAGWLPAELTEVKP
jgi:hypothetical protein